MIEKELHVHIRLSEILDHPTIERLLKLIEAGSRNEPERVGTKLVDGLPHPKSIPLSFAQEQVWFLEKLHPQLNSYRFQALLNCLGSLNADVLERSLNRIVSRHAILRTAFAEDGEAPRQEVRPHVPFTLPREDLRVFPAEEREKELERRIEEELRRPFHLGRPPLIRWRLYQLDEQKYSLLHTEHHFVHDGWSYGVFLEELYATYAALLKGESLPDRTGADAIRRFRALAARNDQLRRLGSSARLLAQRTGGMSSSTAASLRTAAWVAIEALKDRKSATRSRKRFGPNLARLALAKA